jgi:hypothetical protein
MLTRNLLVRLGLLGASFAVTLVATSRGDVPGSRPSSPAIAVIAPAQGVRPGAPSLDPVATSSGVERAAGFASDDDPRVLQIQQQRRDAHATETARRRVVVERLLRDAQTHPLGVLMGKYVDVERRKLSGSPEDIATFQALFADPARGASFAERSLELLPRDGFGFERSAVLAGLDSLLDRGLEARVVLVMLDELAHTLIPAPDLETPAGRSTTLDLGLPQIAHRSLMRASSVSDDAAIAATVRAMLDNGHPTVTQALARQLVAQRPHLKDAFVEQLRQTSYPVSSILWSNADVQ